MIVGELKMDDIISIDGFLGEIRMVTFDFAPQGWMFCNGTKLNISEHMALYTLIGKKYGGDGVTTFQLPDFKGRMPIGAGGMRKVDNKDEPCPVGGVGGQTSVSLTTDNLPKHSHELETQKLKTIINITPQATNTTANTDDPTNAVWANTCDQNNNQQNSFSTALSNLKNMHPIEISVDTELKGKTEVQGGNQAFEIMNPYLAFNFIICVDGLYPMRAD